MSNKIIPNHILPKYEYFIDKYSYFMIECK